MIRISLRTANDFGALIRARRRELGYDQAELAQMAGVSRLWINQVERGKPGASLALVLRTFAALGVELFGNAPDGREPDLRSELPSTGHPDINQIIDITPDINQIIENARRREQK